MSFTLTESEAKRLLGLPLMVKCSNLQNVTSQEISQRFEYLKTNGYPN